MISMKKSNLKYLLIGIIFVMNFYALGLSGVLDQNLKNPDFKSLDPLLILLQNKEWMLVHLSMMNKMGE
jgi:hypothetical protein